MSTAIGTADEFQALRARWTALVAAGELEEALVLVESALAWARERGEATLVERAVCNRAAIACGPGGQRRGSAREIVRRRCAAIRSVTSDPATVADDQPMTNAGGRPATVTSTFDNPSSTLASALTAATTPAAAVPINRSGMTLSSRAAASMSQS